MSFDVWGKLGREAGQAIVDAFAKTRPSVGKRVRSLTTRGKAKGLEGVVLRHERDRYHNPKYDTDWNEVSGRLGYVVQVRADDGQTAWIRADRVEVLS